MVTPPMALQTKSVPHVTTHVSTASTPVLRMINSGAPLALLAMICSTSLTIGVSRSVGMATMKLTPKRVESVSIPVQIVLMII
jgi:hypothetical protein